MSKPHKIFLVGLILFGASACSYQGSLQPHFHAPPQYPKIPLRVALLIDQDLQQLNFSYMGNHGINIKLHPGLADAVKRELGVHFNEVTEIKEPSDASGEELYANVEYLIKEAGRNMDSGEMVFQVDLRMSLKGRSDNQLISSYEQSNRVRVNAKPGGIPKLTESLGEEIERVLKNNISIALRLIGNEMNNDTALHRFAGISTADPEFEKPQYASVPRRLAPSKYEEYLNSVVIVKNSKGFGTGFFVTEGGLIITNHHVVDSDGLVGITRRSREVLRGRVIARDSERDLALISVEGEAFPWLRLGTLEDTSIGLDVVAIGTPEGYDWSIAKGIVSAVRENKDGILEIQTDTALNPGNSGGPLINIQNGRVIGVNAWGLNKNIAEGINFAVSAEEINRAFPDHFKP